MATQQTKQWHANFPIPQRQPPTYSKETLVRHFTILQDLLNAGTLLIDVRRDDYEGGTIRGSLNLPAQTFYFNMATLWRLCQGDPGDSFSNIKRVMFYCNSCSDMGRGPRCAGWFADYVAMRCAAENMPEVPEVYILEGGLRGWIAGGPQYTQFVDGYVPEYWLKFDGVKTVGKRIASRDEEDEQGGAAGDSAMADVVSPTKKLNFGGQ